MPKLSLPPLPGHAPASTPATTSTLPVPDDDTPAEVVGVRPASEVPDVHTVGLAPALLPRVPRGVDLAAALHAYPGTTTGRFVSPVVANTPKPGATVPDPAPPAIDMLDTPLPSAADLDAILPPTPKRRRVGTLDPASGYKRAPWTPEQDLSVRLRAVTAESVEDFLEHFPTRSPEALAHRLNLAARDVENFRDDPPADPMPEYVPRRSLWILDCLEAADRERVAEYSIFDLYRDTVRVFREMATAVRTYAATGETGNIVATTDPHSRAADLRAAFILAMPRPGDPVWPPEGVWFDPDVVPQRGPSGADFLRRVVDAIRDRSARGCVEVYNRRPPPTSAPPAKPVTVAPTVAPSDETHIRFAAGFPVYDPRGVKVGNVVRHDGHGVHIATVPAPEATTPAPTAADTDIAGHVVFDETGTILGTVTGCTGTSIRIAPPAGTKRGKTVDGVTRFLARSATHKAIAAYKTLNEAADAVEPLRRALLSPDPAEPGAVIAVVGALGQTGRMDPTEALRIVLAEVAKLRGLAASVGLPAAIAAADSSIRTAGTLALALDAIEHPLAGRGVVGTPALVAALDSALDAAEEAAKSPMPPIG